MGGYFLLDKQKILKFLGYKLVRFAILLVVKIVIKISRNPLGVRLRVGTWNNHQLLRVVYINHIVNGVIVNTSRPKMAAIALRSISWRGLIIVLL